jgi:cell division protein ZapA (FtsZ GTPase activity inhibitor)
MAQVTVRINGYTYVLGCEDGQEGHLLAMAEQVEARIDSIKAMGGQNGEAKLLVLAALLMADELHDLKDATKANGAAGRPVGPRAGVFAGEARGASGRHCSGARASLD